MRSLSKHGAGSGRAQRHNSVELWACKKAFELQHRASVYCVEGIYSLGNYYSCFQCHQQSHVNQHQKSESYIKPDQCRNFSFRLHLHALPCCATNSQTHEDGQNKQTVSLLTVSNAAEKLRRMRTDDSLAYLAARNFSVTATRSVSGESVRILGSARSSTAARPRQPMPDMRSRHNWTVSTSTVSEGSCRSHGRTECPTQKLYRYPQNVHQPQP